LLEKNMAIDFFKGIVIAIVVSSIGITIGSICGERNAWGVFGPFLAVLMLFLTSFATITGFFCSGQRHVEHTKRRAYSLGESPLSSRP
jgi:uncharacterized membrane protein